MKFQKLKPAIAILFFSNVVIGTPSPSTLAYVLAEEDDATLAEQYIENYHNYAISEMERTAVLASITLGQGMIESGYGTSELATKANNHFGIKCSNGWEGETFTHHSNENVNGSLIARKSCFRLYGTVEESFQDHSDFLASRSNYSFIFQENSKDYKFWAEGLVKAKYATDPEYAKKLINVIKTFGLDKYDKYTNTVLAFNNSTEELEYKEDLQSIKNKIHTIESVLSQSELYKTELTESINASIQELAELKTKQDEMQQKLNEKIATNSRHLAEQQKMIENFQSRLQRVENIQQNMLKSDPLIGFFNPDGSLKTQADIFPVRHVNRDGIFYQSGRKATVVTQNSNLFQIAEQYNINLKDLLKYNDLEDDKDLPVGFYVYIEAKANYVKSQTEPHQVKIGETVHTISQRYGIKTTKIYQRNHLKKGEEPQSGEYIFLNEVSEKQPKLKDDSTNPIHDNKFNGGGSGNR